MREIFNKDIVYKGEKKAIFRITHIENGEYYGYGYTYKGDKVSNHHFGYAENIIFLNKVEDPESIELFEKRFNQE